jgi:hypothetical protein
MSDEEQAEIVEIAIKIALDFYPYRTPMDWDDLLYRVEVQAEIDLPEDMTDPFIERIKREVRKARREAAV